MAGLDSLTAEDFKKKMLPFFNKAPTDKKALTGPSTTC